MDNWGEVTKLSASNEIEPDGFGNSVAISGDTIVVGAQGADNNGANYGSAYIFD